MSEINPKDFIITRKRKKYKFALFHNSTLCFEASEWGKSSETDVLEMGAGTGLFSTVLATASSQKQFVAIDVKADRLQTGARAAEMQGLTNVRFLRGRGDLLEDFFERNSLETVWITFPDPFPKERSAKHRLTHPRFLDAYESLLRKDGALYFKTDALDLFHWSVEQLVDQGWRIQEVSFDLHNSTLNEIYKIKTTYEARYMIEGRMIRFLKALPPLAL